MTTLASYSGWGWEGGLLGRLPALAREHGGEPFCFQFRVLRSELQGFGHPLSFLGIGPGAGLRGCTALSGFGGVDPLHRFAAVLGSFLRLHPRLCRASRAHLLDTGRLLHGVLPRCTQTGASALGVVGVMGPLVGDGRLDRLGAFFADLGVLPKFGLGLAAALQHTGALFGVLPRGFTAFSKSRPNLGVFPISFGGCAHQRQSLGALGSVGVTPPSLGTFNRCGLLGPSHACHPVSPDCWIDPRSGHVFRFEPLATKAYVAENAIRFNADAPELSNGLLLCRKSVDEQVVRCEDGDCRLNTDSKVSLENLLKPSVRMLPGGSGVHEMGARSSVCSDAYVKRSSKIRMLWALLDQAVEDRRHSIVSLITDALSVVTKAVSMAKFIQLRNGAIHEKAQQYQRVTEGSLP